MSERELIVGDTAPEPTEDNIEKLKNITDEITSFVSEGEAKDLSDIWDHFFKKAEKINRRTALPIFMGLMKPFNGHSSALRIDAMLRLDDKLTLEERKFITRYKLANALYSWIKKDDGMVYKGSFTSLPYKIAEGKNIYIRTKSFGGYEPMQTADMIYEIMNTQGFINTEQRLPSMSNCTYLIRRSKNFFLAIDLVVDGKMLNYGVNIISPMMYSLGKQETKKEMLGDLIKEILDRHNSSCPNFKPYKLQSK